MAKAYDWEEALVLNKAMTARQMFLGIPSKVFAFITFFCVAASVTMHWTTGIIFGVPMSIWMYRESYLDADGVYLRIKNALANKRLSLSDVKCKSTNNLED